ncbi:MAG: hypothetical protein ACKVZ0_24470 [Gemmatimonadales bacterium]
MTGGFATERQRVEVHLVDRRVLHGVIHLQGGARHHSGPETPADMLNRTEEFFALVLDGEQPLFLAKRHVLYVQLPAQPAIDDPDRASAARRIELEIELADGSLHEGVVMYELPPDRPRALDFLNTAPAFFPLWAPDGVRVINASQLRTASPLVDTRRASP